jgi:hypothetical protein
MMPRARKVSGHRERYRQSVQESHSRPFRPIQTVCAQTAPATAAPKKIRKPAQAGIAVARFVSRALGDARQGAQQARSAAQQAQIQSRQAQGCGMFG